MSRKETITLLLIIAAGIITRMFAIWIDRPEFVGWFNHTYYYYVEVRGLLHSGSLPYNDMPLLFYLYAIVATVFQWIGMEENAAIVNGTRLVMSIVPALVPLAVYGIVKQLNEGAALRGTQWLLIFAGGFLPLSIGHMPELLQKNALGMTLLAFFLMVIFQLLRNKSAGNFSAAVLLATAIVLTHFGTFGVLFLYILALLAVYIIHQRTSSNVINAGILLGTFAVISLLLIYSFDSQRFERIFIFLTESVSRSFLADLFSSATAAGEKLIAAAFLILPLLIFYFLYRQFARQQAQLPESERIFWLSLLIFAYLLILPVWDQQHHLMGRLALFLPLPLLLIFIFLEKYSLKKVWLRRGVPGLIVAGVLLMTFGELMSAKFHNRNGAEIFADIQTLQAQQNFQDDDLIITLNGAEHISNWFLNVKAGVIPTLTLQDFQRYKNIYVLNPIQGELNFNDIKNKTIQRQSDKYIFMRRNIPRPADIQPLYHSDHIEFFRLGKPPAEWRFDVVGNWIGYGEFPDEWLK